MLNCSSSFFASASQKDQDNLNNREETEAIYFTAFSESTRIEGWLDMKATAIKLKEGLSFLYIAYIFWFLLKVTTV